jgi:predicted aminopeptidase
MHIDGALVDIDVAAPYAVEKLGAAEQPALGAAAVEAVRTELDAVYRSDLSEEEKRRKKAEAFSRLRAQWGAIVPAEPNNAFLVSVSVYTQLVPAFERLLAETGGNLPAFYTRVRELAAAQKPARQLALR